MKTNLTVRQLIARYISELDRAEPTKSMYRFCVNRFYRFITQQALNAYSITKVDLIEYKNHLKQQDKSPYTIDLYMSALKSFYSWLEDAGITQNITHHIRRERRSDDISRKPLSIEQIRHLIASIPETTLLNLRDLAIIRLLYFNGLRVIEAARLNLDDINTHSNTIKITGKGRAHRETALINIAVADAVSRYIQARFDAGYSCEPNDPLFISHPHHRTKRATRLDNNYISRTITMRLTKAGLKAKDITAHSLRHSAAVHNIDAGADLYAVTLFLRHTNPNTARIYTRYAEANKIALAAPTINLLRHYNNTATQQH